jgi:hypothetical protein
LNRISETHVSLGGNAQIVGQALNDQARLDGPFMLKPEMVVLSALGRLPLFFSTSFGAKELISHTFLILKSMTE